MIYDPAEEEGLSWPPTAYPYQSGVTGGLVGALGMAVVALTYGIISGRGIWLPVNLIGATAIRTLQGESEATLAAFNAPALLAGLAIHVSLATLIGVLYTLLLPTLPGPPLLWAVPVGLFLWAIAFLTLPLVNPVMTRYVDVLSFSIAHIAYGLILGTWVARSSKMPVLEE